MVTPSSELNLPTCSMYVGNVDTPIFNRQKILEIQQPNASALNFLTHVIFMINLTRINRMTD
jgi:hypothetical protein